MTGCGVQNLTPGPGVNVHVHDKVQDLTSIGQCDIDNAKSLKRKL